MTKAEIRFRRADTLYHWAVRIFFAFAFVMLIVIISQVAVLQSSLDKSQVAELKRQEVAREEARQRLERALAETNHQQTVTQNYIRCIATLSLEPIEQRTAAQLDACGIPGVTDPNKLGNPTPAAQPTVTPAPTQQPTTKTTTTDTSGSGDTPADKKQPSSLGKLPFVGGLFRAIGL